MGGFSVNHENIISQRKPGARTTYEVSHTMVRVADLDESLEFYCAALGLKELRRYENEQGRFTLVFLSAPEDEEAQVELTYNWDPESYDGGRNFGHWPTTSMISMKAARDYGIMESL